LEFFYGNEEIMDEFILEALHENPFHHQEDMVTSIFPKNEVDQIFDADSYDSVFEFDENLHQYC